MSRRLNLIAAGVLIVAAILGTACARKPAAERLKAWSGEIARLEAEQDSLRARAAELIARDERIRKLPQGEIVVGVPTAFVREVISALFRDVVDNVTLSLSGIKTRVSKSVKKVVTVGEFVVDVDIQKVIGRLSPKEPSITFGGDRVSLVLPVSLTEGSGEALIHFVWDGKNVADVTCGDMDVTQKVSGNVIPSDYVVTGSLSLAIQGRRVVGSLQFPETRLRIRVKPSQASWDAVNALLAEKQGVCGWVLEKVDVPGILSKVTETKGFNVRLPLEKLKPFAVPAGVRDSVTVGGRTLAVSAETRTLRIDPDAIWYSASVRVERGGP